MRLLFTLAEEEKHNVACRATGTIPKAGKLRHHINRDARELKPEGIHGQSKGPPVPRRPG